MSFEVEQSPENNGLVHVDHAILDSMKKSWLVPRGTGNLPSPNRQEISIEERVNFNSQINIDLNKTQ
jgi:hypothetical protein